VEIPNYFAINLRYLLKRIGKSQAWLGEKLGKDRTSISAYVGGKSQPDLDVTIKIASIFEVSLDSLMLTDLKSENFSQEQVLSKGTDREEDTYDIREGKATKNLTYALTLMGSALTDILKDALSHELQEIRDVMEKGLIDDTVKGQIDYIFSTLKKAELQNEIEKTVEKIKD